MTKERALLTQAKDAMSEVYDTHNIECRCPICESWNAINALLAEPEGEDAIWDATLMDGLRDEPPFPAPLSCAEGEVMEVVGHRYDTDGRPTLTVAGLYGEQIQTGDRVRVVRVEEAP